MWDLDFSPDGLLLLTASRDGAARVWDPASGRLAYPPVRHPAPVLRARFERPPAAASLGRPSALSSPAPPPAAPPQLPQALQGPALITAAGDGLTRRWLARPALAPAAELHQRPPVRFTAFSPDGRRVPSLRADFTVHVWQLFSGDAPGGAKEVATLPATAGEVTWWAGFGTDGRRVVTARRNQGVCEWDLGGEGAGVGAGVGAEAAGGPEPRLLRVLFPGAPATPRADSGRRTAHFRAVVVRPLHPTGPGGPAARGGLLRRRGSDRRHRQRRRRRQARRRRPDATVDFSPDGRYFTTAGRGEDSPALRHATPRYRPTAGRWRRAGRRPGVGDAGSGEPVSPPMPHGHRVARAVFSPDGARLATCSWDGTARLWDLRGNPLPVPPLRHAAPVRKVAFSPDGRVIATASEDRSARLWDADTGRPISPPLPHPAAVNHVYFSPDGMLLLTDPPLGGAGPGCWEVATGLPVPLPLAAGGVPGEAREAGEAGDASVRSAAFSPVGSRVLSVAGDGSVRLWDLVPDPRPVGALVRLAEVLLGQRIDATGAPVPMEPQEWRDRWEGGSPGGASVGGHAP